jgi:uncharacterized membrane protein YraQ (UPF0718 family)
MRIFVVLAAIFCAQVLAHDSCCKHKHAKRAKEFIPDPHDSPPDEFNGQQREIRDPNAEQPSDWDEEDDGPWRAALVPNPSFEWKPKMIKNPNYVPGPTFLVKLKGEVLEAIPWVTLGILMTALLDVTQLPLDKLRNHLSSTGPLSSLKAALIGLATPLCSCGVVPIAAGFVANGVPVAAVVAFLTASQSAGLDSAAITWGLLGPAAALCRLGGAVVLAVAAGMAVPQGSTAAYTTDACKDRLTPKQASNLLVRLASSLVSTAAEIFPMVLAGLTLSTAAVHVLPELTSTYEALQGTESALSLSFWGPIIIRFAVLASAVPLQLCEHTTVTLAAGIQKAGGSPGLAFAFLLSAPAINLPTLFLLLRTQQRKGALGFAAARVVLALTLTALVLSYVVDYTGVDMLVQQEADAGGEMLALPSWYVQGSYWLAGLLSLVAACHALAGSGGSTAVASEGAGSGCCAPGAKKTN